MARPTPLGHVDHAQRRAVLDAPARIEELELGEELARQVASAAIETHERRVADQIEEGVGGFHGRAPVRDPSRLHPIVEREWFVGEDDHGKSGAMELDGDLHDLVGLADHADLTRDVSPELGDRADGKRSRRDVELPPGSGRKPKRHGHIADADEDVHS
jgi:hypothetical protein